MQTTENTNHQERLDTAALATLATVVKAMRVRALHRDAAVELVATTTGATVDEVLALLDRAALVVAAQVRGEA